MIASMGEVMAGLVEEIQAKVLDKSVSTTELLRMVKLAASKLQLNDAIEWVDHELKGYPTRENLPDYRRTAGELKAHNPLRGPIPVNGDPEMIRKISEQDINEPISKIEALCGDGTGQLMSKVNGELTNAILKGTGGIYMDLYVHMSAAVFVDIQQQVRNLILDWAVSLEQAGVRGEGMSFSMEEKKAAEAAPSIIHNYGVIHNGDNSGNQNRTMVGSTDNSTNSLDIDSTFQNLAQAVKTGVADEAHRKDLLEIIKAMEANHGTSDYVPLFQKLVGYAADYATVLTPFIPALSQLLA